MKKAEKATPCQKLNEEKVCTSKKDEKDQPFRCNPYCALKKRKKSILKSCVPQTLSVSVTMETVSVQTSTSMLPKGKVCGKMAFCKPCVGCPPCSKDMRKISNANKSEDIFIDIEFIHSKRRESDSSRYDKEKTEAISDDDKSVQSERNESDSKIDEVDQSEAIFNDDKSVHSERKETDSRKDDTDKSEVIAHDDRSLKSDGKESDSRRDDADKPDAIPIDDRSILSGRIETDSRPEGTDKSEALYIDDKSVHSERKEIDSSRDDADKSDAIPIDDGSMQSERKDTDSIKGDTDKSDALPIDNGSIQSERKETASREGDADKSDTLPIDGGSTHSERKEIDSREGDADGGSTQSERKEIDSRREEADEAIRESSKNSSVSDFSSDHRDMKKDDENLSDQLKSPSPETSTTMSKTIHDREDSLITLCENCLPCSKETQRLAKQSASKLDNSSTQTSETLLANTDSKKATKPLRDDIDETTSKQSRSSRGDPNTSEQLQDIEAHENRTLEKHDGKISQRSSHVGFQFEDLNQNPVDNLNSERTFEKNEPEKLDNETGSCADCPRCIGCPSCSEKRKELEKKYGKNWKDTPKEDVLNNNLGYGKNEADNMISENSSCIDCPLCIGCPSCSEKRKELEKKYGEKWNERTFDKKDELNSISGSGKNKPDNLISGNSSCTDCPLCVGCPSCSEKRKELENKYGENWKDRISDNKDDMKSSSRYEKHDPDILVSGNSSCMDCPLCVGCPSCSEKRKGLENKQGEMWKDKSVAKKKCSPDECDVGSSRSSTSIAVDANSYCHSKCGSHNVGLIAISVRVKYPSCSNEVNKNIPKKPSDQLKSIFSEIGGLKAETNVENFEARDYYQENAEDDLSCVAYFPRPDVGNEIADILPVKLKNISEEMFPMDIVGRNGDSGDEFWSASSIIETKIEKTLELNHMTSRLSPRVMSSNVLRIGDFGSLGNVLYNEYQSNEEIYTRRTSLMSQNAPYSKHSRVFKIETRKIYSLKDFKMKEDFIYLSSGPQLSSLKDISPIPMTNSPNERSKREKPELFNNRNSVLSNDYTLIKGNISKRKVFPKTQRSTAELNTSKPMDSDGQSKEKNTQRSGKINKNNTNYSNGHRKTSVVNRIYTKPQTASREFNESIRSSQSEMSNIWSTFRRKSSVDEYDSELSVEKEDKKKRRSSVGAQEQLQMENLDGMKQIFKETKREKSSFANDGAELPRNSSNQPYEEEVDNSKAESKMNGKNTSTVNPVYPQSSEDNVKSRPLFSKPQGILAPISMDDDYEDVHPEVSNERISKYGKKGTDRRISIKLASLPSLSSEENIPQAIRKNFDLQSSRKNFEARRSSTKSQTSFIPVLQLYEEDDEEIPEPITENLSGEIKTPMPLEKSSSENIRTRRFSSKSRGSMKPIEMGDDLDARYEEEGSKKENIMTPRKVSSKSKKLSEQIMPPKSEDKILKKLKNENLEPEGEEETKPADEIFYENDDNENANPDEVIRDEEERLSATEIENLEMKDKKNQFITNAAQSEDKILNEKERSLSAVITALMDGSSKGDLDQEKMKTTSIISQQSNEDDSSATEYTGKMQDIPEDTAPTVDSGVSKEEKETLRSRSNSKSSLTVELGFNETVNEEQNITDELRRASMEHNASGNISPTDHLAGATADNSRNPSISSRRSRSEEETLSSVYHKTQSDDLDDIGETRNETNAEKIDSETTNITEKSEDDKTLNIRTFEDPPCGSCQPFGADIKIVVKQLPDNWRVVSSNIYESLQEVTSSESQKQNVNLERNENTVCVDCPPCSSVAKTISYQSANISNELFSESEISNFATSIQSKRDKKSSLTTETSMDVDYSPNENFSKSRKPSNMANNTSRESTSPVISSKTADSNTQSILEDVDFSNKMKTTHRKSIDRTSLSVNFSIGDMEKNGSETNTESNASGTSDADQLKQKSMDKTQCMDCPACSHVIENIPEKLSDEGSDSSSKHIKKYSLITKSSSSSEYITQKDNVISIAKKASLTSRSISIVTSSYSQSIGNKREISKHTDQLEELPCSKNTLCSTNYKDFGRILSAKLKRISSKMTESLQNVTNVPCEENTKQPSVKSSEKSFCVDCPPCSSEVKPSKVQSKSSKTEGSPFFEHTRHSQSSYLRKKIFDRSPTISPAKSSISQSSESERPSYVGHPRNSQASYLKKKIFDVSPSISPVVSSTRASRIDEESLPPTNKKRLSKCHPQQKMDLDEDIMSNECIDFYLNLITERFKMKAMDVDDDEFERMFEELTRELNDLFCECGKINSEFFEKYMKPDIVEESAEKEKPESNLINEELLKKMFDDMKIYLEDKFCSCRSKETNAVISTGDENTLSQNESDRSKTDVSSDKLDTNSNIDDDSEIFEDNSQTEMEPAEVTSAIDEKTSENVDDGSFTEDVSKKEVVQPLHSSVKGDIKTPSVNTIDNTSAKETLNATISHDGSPNTTTETEQNVGSKITLIEEKTTKNSVEVMEQDLEKIDNDKTDHDVTSVGQSDRDSIQLPNPLGGEDAVDDKREITSIRSVQSQNENLEPEGEEETKPADEISYENDDNENANPGEVIRDEQERLSATEIQNLEMIDKKNQFITNAAPFVPCGNIECPKNVSNAGSKNVASVNLMNDKQTDVTSSKQTGSIASKSSTTKNVDQNKQINVDLIDDKPKDSVTTSIKSESIKSKSSTIKNVPEHVDKNKQIIVIPMEEKPKDSVTTSIKSESIKSKSSTIKNVPVPVDKSKQGDLKDDKQKANVTGSNKSVSVKSKSSTSKNVQGSDALHDKNKQIIAHKMADPRKTYQNSVAKRDEIADEDDDFHSATTCAEVYEQEETYLTLFDKVAMNPMKLSDLFPRHVQIADYSENGSNHESFFTAECPYFYEVSKVSTVYAQNMSCQKCCSDKQVGTHEYIARSRAFQDARIYQIEPDGKELAEVGIKRDGYDMRENVDRIKVRVRLTDERNSKKSIPHVGSIRTATEMSINRSGKFSMLGADFNVKYEKLNEKIVDETKVVTDGDNIKILIPLDNNFGDENK